MDAGQRERQWNLSLALALSAGLHLIALLTLDVSPARWRHGLQPALRVMLKQVAPVPLSDLQLPLELPFAVSPPLEPAPEAIAEPVPRSDTPLEAPEKAAPADEGAVARAPQPGAGMPLADRYFRRSEVDVPAEPIERGPLVYPEHAFFSRLPGTVRARIYISESGAVDAVELVEAHPPGHFEQAALEALRQVRYQPALLSGRPVKSQKLIEVSFKPYEDAPAGGSR
jgi:protein TonB